MNSLVFDVPPLTLVIPMWSLLLFVGFLGVCFVWLSHRSERKGIYVLSPNNEADRHFRKYHVYKVLSYLVLLVFLYIVGR